MNTAALIILILFQIKHWVVDFKYQTMEMVNHKGVYGHPKGILHSAQHATGTALILLFMSVFFHVPIGALLGAAIFLADGILHYHIDWAKMNWGNRDIQNPRFWEHLGLDQALHHLTYIGISAILAL